MINNENIYYLAADETHKAVCRKCNINLMISKLSQSAIDHRLSKTSFYHAENYTTPIFFPKFTPIRLPQFTNNLKFNLIRPVSKLRQPHTYSKTFMTYHCQSTPPTETN